MPRGLADGGLKPQYLHMFWLIKKKSVCKMLFVFLSTGWDGTGGSIVWLLQSAMPSSAACTRSDADFECVLAMIKEGYGMIMLAAVLRRRCLTDSVVSWSWRRLFVARSDCGQCAFADCSCSLAQDLIIVTRRGGRQYAICLVTRVGHIAQALFILSQRKSMFHMYCEWRNDDPCTTQYFVPVSL